MAVPYKKGTWTDGRGGTSGQAALLCTKELRSLSKASRAHPRAVQLLLQR